MSWINALLAQNPLVSRLIEETYTLESGGSLELETQTGEVRIIASDRPDVSLSLRIEGRDTDQLNQISLEEKRFGSQVQLATEWEDELTPAIALLSDLELTYTLEVPRDITLAVSHGQGELFLDGIFTGSLDLKMRQGLLQADSLMGEGNRIRSNFSKVDVAYIHEGEIQLQMGQLILDEAHRLELESLGAIVEIGMANQLTLMADLGDVQVKEVGQITGQYGAAQVRIERLGNSLDMEGKLAPALTIGSLGEDVSHLRLIGQATSIQLKDIRQPAVFLEVDEARFESTGLETSDPYESPSETGGGQNYRLAPMTTGRSAPGTLKVMMPSQGGSCEIRFQ